MLMNQLSHSKGMESVCICVSYNIATTKLASCFPIERIDPGPHVGSTALINAGMIGCVQLTFTYCAIHIHLLVDLGGGGVVVHQLCCLSCPSVLSPQKP